MPDLGGPVDHVQPVPRMTHLPNYIQRMHPLLLFVVRSREHLLEVQSMVSSIALLERTRQTNNHGLLTYLLLGKRSL